MPSDTAFLITVEIPLKPTQIIYPFGSQLRGYLPYFLHGRLHQPRPLFASEKMYSSPSLPLLYSVFNILSLYAEEFKNKVQLFKRTRDSLALYCCFVYWWGIDKSGRVRYRYGFPAAEETRHRGRDTGQTRRAYSSFFSAEDRAQNL